MVLYLSLQFHPPVLKPGLDLSNKKKKGGDSGDKSETLPKDNVRNMNNRISAAFAILLQMELTQLH